MYPATHTHPFEAPLPPPPPTPSPSPIFFFHLMIPSGCYELRFPGCSVFTFQGSFNVWILLLFQLKTVVCGILYVSLSMLLEYWHGVLRWCIVSFHHCLGRPVLLRCVELMWSCSTALCCLAYYGLWKIGLSSHPKNVIILFVFESMVVLCTPCPLQALCHTHHMKDSNCPNVIYNAQLVSVSLCHCVW